MDGRDLVYISLSRYSFGRVLVRLLTHVMEMDMEVCVWSDKLRR